MNEQTNQIKVGTIFLMTYGYDQTNVHFFQVTRTSPKGVFVREIACKGVEGTEGFMCQDVVPVPNSFLEKSQWCGGFGGKNEEIFRKVTPGKYVGFSIKGRYFAHVWNGEKTYQSWYA